MKKARTLKDIENHPFVESTHTEWDGCFTDSLGREVQGRWVYLKAGYICPPMECGTIHERSIKDCCDMLNEARRCTLRELEWQGYPLADAQASWLASEGCGHYDMEWNDDGDRQCRDCGAVLD